MSIFTEKQSFKKIIVSQIQKYKLVQKSQHRKLETTINLKHVQKG